jgi:hypothetical protein
MDVCGGSTMKVREWWGVKTLSGQRFLYVAKIAIQKMVNLLIVLKTGTYMSQWFRGMRLCRTYVRYPLT